MNSDNIEKLVPLKVLLLLVVPERRGQSMSHRATPAGKFLHWVTGVLLVV
jgi:hypothetical protein